MWCAFCFDVKLLMQITAMSFTGRYATMDILSCAGRSMERAGFLCKKVIVCRRWLQVYVDDEAHREILSQLVSISRGKIFADMVLLNQNT